MLIVLMITLFSFMSCANTQTPAPAAAPAVTPAPTATPASTPKGEVKKGAKKVVASQDVLGKATKLICSKGADERTIEVTDRVVLYKGQEVASFTSKAFGLGTADKIKSHLESSGFSCK